MWEQLTVLGKQQLMLHVGAPCTQVVENGVHAPACWVTGESVAQATDVCSGWPINLVLLRTFVVFVTFLLGIFAGRHRHKQVQHILLEAAKA